MVDKSVSGLSGRKTDFDKDVVSARFAWAKTQEEIDRVTNEISLIDSELQGKDFGLDNIQALQSKLRTVVDDLIHRNAEVQQTTDRVNSWVLKLDRLRDERTRLAKDQSEAQVIDRRFTATQNVVNTLKKLKDDWLGIVQGYLDGQLKENWKQVAQLDRLVEFTEEFQLSIKERGPTGAWTISAPSSANLRALALCFVSALIKLAAQIGKVEAGQENKRQQPFQGGDYPLVMDAPFATMDSHFKRTVPLGLRKVVPQMVVIINHDQWNGEVAEVLQSSVGNAYVLELHTPGGEDTDISVLYNGRNLDYVVSEQDANTDWSIINEVLQ